MNGQKAIDTTQACALGRLHSVMIGVRQFVVLIFVLHISFLRAVEDLARGGGGGGGAAGCFDAASDPVGVVNAYKCVQHTNPAAGRHAPKAVRFVLGGDEVKNQ